MSASAAPAPGVFPMGHDWVAILDFGSQYSQLIARRLREHQVYCELLRFDTPAAELAARRPKGIILSGGPASVLAPGAPDVDPAIFELGVPLLGICYGMQLMGRHLGGTVQRGESREFGLAQIEQTDPPGELFTALPDTLSVWMSHGDQVAVPPPGFRVTARTDTCPVAAMEHPERHWHGLQFHPEVVHTPYGRDLLQRFLFRVCGCAGDWKMSTFIEESVRTIRERVGGDQVLLGLSGGVDSSVAAALIHRAIGPQLHCVFVDNGLMRAKETEQVEDLFGRAFGVDLHVVRAGPRFLDALRGATEPERKRKIIGREFIEVFAEKARSFGEVTYLAQGTLYPDVIESVHPSGGPSATIKSHHNVGGLPPDLKFKLLEPLRELFKDEVRLVGRELGLPDFVVDRQPFPGPGLGVRILGEVTAERVAILQQADLRVQEECLALPTYRDIWQAFAVLLPVCTVGVMGDERTYENVVAVRAVSSQDGMTADWYRLPYDTLDRIARRIINEVRGVNRVVFDISSKPPSTIEWE
jgi:GMP synthase (glutamine-hydrolysing)